MVLHTIDCARPSKSLPRSHNGRIAIGINLVRSRIRIIDVSSECITVIRRICDVNIVVDGASGFDDSNSDIWKLRESEDRNSVSIT